jgi:uncharacterized coiled-coil protein SlyX
MVGAMTVEEQEKSPERLLLQAERRIKKLEAKMAGQQETIRELRGQIRHDDNLAERISELKAEVGELKAEIKEVTRANHDHVSRYEAMRDETLTRKGAGRLSSMARAGAEVAMDRVVAIAAE